MIPGVRRARRAARPSETFRPDRVARDDAGRPRTSRAADLALIAVFLVAIGLPAAALVFGWEAGYVLRENRNLRPWPGLPTTRAELAAFPIRFEAYFNDHFGFRSRLIRGLALTRVRALGVSSSAEVALGRDGWLFFGPPWLLDLYRAADPFTVDELEGWRACFQARRDWLAERGIPYLVVIPPDKCMIYPEQMPRYLRRLKRPTRLGQLLAYLRAHSDLAILDLRQPLWAAKTKGDGPLYFRQDTHWNPRGAFVAYTEIVRALSAWFPAMRPLPIEDFRYLGAIGEESDLARMLGLAVEPSQEALMLVPRTPQARPGPPIVEPPPGTPPILVPIVYQRRPDAGLPHAVIFRDSFSTLLIPLLSEHFGRIVYASQYTFNRALVEFERPQVVIQEMVERNLMGRVPVDTQ